MIEPTESENILELERFILAINEILDNPTLDEGTLVPSRVPRTKVDEVKVARTLRLNHFEDPAHLKRHCTLNHPLEKTQNHLPLLLR
jgi:glycine cleavage system protein P-like pyridoxal-binding family